VSADEAEELKHVTTTTFAGAQQQSTKSTNENREIMHKEHTTKVQAIMQAHSVKSKGLSHLVKNPTPVINLHPTNDTICEKNQGGGSF